MGTNMQSLRLTTPTLRSATRALSMRMYSTGSDAPAGSIARSKGWNTREKAQEDQYIIQHEKEKLEKRTCGCECECRCTNLGQSVSRCTSSRSLSTTSRSKRSLNRSPK